MTCNADRIVDDRNRLYGLHEAEIKATVRSDLRKMGLYTEWPDTTPAGRCVVGYRSGLPKA